LETLEHFFAPLLGLMIAVFKLSLSLAQDIDAADLPAAVKVLRQLNKKLGQNL
jgi:hypothetical protein